MIILSDRIPSRISDNLTCNMLLDTEMWLKLANLIHGPKGEGALPMIRQVMPDICLLTLFIQAYKAGKQNW